MTQNSVDAARTSVRAEYLSPAEIEIRLSERSLVYLPVGSLEFHGPHLPIGLDSLLAHGICTLAAQRAGGVVLPAIYQGIGGEHSEYPWTIMMSSSMGIESHIAQTLERLEQFGVRATVLFTGHSAGEQVTMIESIAAQWNANPAHTLRVTALGIHQCPTSPMQADHAGAFETLVLEALHPELVHLDRLPSALDHPTVDPDGNTWGQHRHDPEHPLWGIFGDDPRERDPRLASELLETLVTWLASVARPSPRHEH